MVELGQECSHVNLAPGQWQKPGLLHQATDSLYLGTTRHVFSLTLEVNSAGLCGRKVLTSLSLDLFPVREGLWM